MDADQDSATQREPSMARALAADVSDAAKSVVRGYAAGTVGSLLNLGYMVVLVFGTLGVLIGAAIVAMLGFGVTHLILPDADGWFGVAWFAVFLVILALGARRIVRATRGVEAGIARVTDAIAPSPARIVDRPAASPSSATTSVSLAELDARFAVDPPGAGGPDEGARNL